MGAPLPRALWIDGQAGIQLITLANEGRMALNAPQEGVGIPVPWEERSRGPRGTWRGLTLD